MKRLTCEMCGSTDLVKDGGVFVCQVCGCKYTLEEARKMMVEGTVEVTGTVKVDNTASIANYLKMAQNALESNNNEEAESYANKIIELDPQNSAAWEIKGEAAGWQSKANNNRMSEAVVAWLNAISFAKEEDLSALRGRIADKYVRLWAAMVSLRTGNFGRIQSEENLKSTVNDVNNGIDMMNNLTIKGGVSFNRSRIYEVIAKSMNSGAVDGYSDAKKDFGPEHRNMAKWQWNNFTGSCDNCVKLLERSSEMVRSTSLGRTICDNVVTIGEAARDSKSWKFNVNSWNADNYDEDFSFTAEAKKYRTQTIDKYKEKKKFINSDPAKEVLKAVQGNRKAAEIALAKKQYWEEHQAEKLQLEEEKNQINARIRAIDAEIRALPVLARINVVVKMKDDTQAQISAKEREMGSLGLFKGKEKKAIQAQIDELKVQLSRVQGKLSQLEETAKTEKKPLEAEKNSLKKRIGEIDNEFNKDRGQISVKGQFAIPGATVDGKIMVTPNALFNHLKGILPEPYVIEEIKLQGCDFHENLSGTYAMIVKDMSISGDNKNSGTIVYVEADNLESPIKTILVQTSENDDVKHSKVYVTLGSLVLLSLCADLSQGNAEALMCNLLYSDSSSLYGEADLRIEYASYTQNLLGLINLNYNIALIRAKD